MNTASYTYRFLKINVVFIFIVFGYLNLFAQDEEGHHTHSCTPEGYTSHMNVIMTKYDSLINDFAFNLDFSNRYHIDYNSFDDVNSFFTSLIKRTIIDKTFEESTVNIARIEQILHEEIERFALQDELWFEVPSEHRVSVFYYGKNGYNLLNTDDDDTPKTALCLNAGFESNNWTGWETICARATSGFSVTNLQNYTPPANCSSPSGSPTQHILWNGGNDAIGGFPRVFQGAYSAMLGNGAQANNPAHQAAMLRKTFVVDPLKTLLTYSYAAVLDNGGGHSPPEQPFFNVRVYIDGSEQFCSYYHAYAGDGQPEWTQNGSRFFRDWTSISIPLHEYIGSTVVVEFTVSDCYVSGGNHYAYAYVDVSCSDLEITKSCEGTNTVLHAPTAGIVAHEWNTGETTPDIVITSPGIYSCYVLPYGSDCSALISYDATLFPVPTADFSVNHTMACAGSPFVFTNESSIETGGQITGYQWTYGDGIVAPMSSGGNIVGVAQTTGTYEGTNTHTYNSLGTYTVNLRINTADGCWDTINKVVEIISGPQVQVASDQSVCIGETPPEITITGSPTEGPFTFTYNVNGGGNQTITTAPGETSVSIPIPKGSTGSYTYTVTHVSDAISETCQNDVNESATVDVNPLPSATIGSSTSVCIGDASPTITFTGSNGLTGTTYQFTYSIDGGPTQTITGSNTATISVPTSVAGTYTYTLHSVEDLNSGCLSDVTTNNTAVITVVDLPSATTSGSIQVCQGDVAPVVTFTGSSPGSEYIFTYNINGGPSQTINTPAGSNSATLSQSTAVPGTYVYTLTNVQFQGNTCNQDLSLTETITVNGLPNATVSQPLQACFNDTDAPTVTFTGNNGVAPYTFVYNINGSTNQTVVSTGDSYTFTVPTDAIGTFTINLVNVQESSAIGCSQDINTNTQIIIHPLPNVNAGNDLTVCDGEQIVLTGAGALTYSWDNNAYNGIPFVINQTTTFTVVGTDVNGCQNTDQVLVNVVPIPQMDFAGENLSGCAPIMPILTNNSTGNLTNCTWYIGNGEVIQGCGVVSTQFNNPGCYDVTLVVSTPEGCANTLTRTEYICVYSNPVADFTPTPNLLTTYQWESNMVNESMNATSFVWDFGDGSPLSSEFSPTHAFPNDNAAVYQITLIAYSADGCADTTIRTVQVDDELLFYVPNTFTPDGDAFNETFMPVFTAGFDPYNYSLYIYNRWGEMVFESHDASIGWNGRYGLNGDVCQDGTYTWKIEVKRKSTDERKMFVGHVTIIR